MNENEIGINATKEDTVTISKKEYLNLIESANILAALECAGVDNWSGYELAMEKESNYFKDK